MSLLANNARPAVTLLSCPQDVLELVLSYLNVGRELCNVQLSCSTLKDAFFNIEPTDENLETWVAHHVKMLEHRAHWDWRAVSDVDFSASPEITLSSKLWYVAETLRTAAQNAVAPVKEKAEDLQTQEADLMTVSTTEIAQVHEELKQLRRDEINELMAFYRPPAEMLAVAEITLIIMKDGSREPWDDFKRATSSLYFLRDVLEYDVMSAKALSDRKLHHVRKAVEKTGLASMSNEIIKQKCGRFIAGLQRWCLVLMDHMTRMKDAAPLMQMKASLMAPYHQLTAKESRMMRVAQQIHNVQQVGFLRAEQAHRKCLQVAFLESTERLYVEELAEREGKKLFGGYHCSQCLHFETIEAAARCLIADLQHNTPVCCQGDEMVSRAEISAAEARARMAFPHAPTKRDLRNYRSSVKGTVLTAPPVLAARHLATQRNQPLHMQQLISRQQKRL